MADRAYTVHELDALRNVVERKYLFGTYRISAGIRVSRSYKEEEKVECVEELVRSHMLAGHTAEDLINSEPPEPTP